MAELGKRVPVIVTVGVVVGLWLVLATKPAPAQDLTTDLALLLRGTIPQVSVTVDGATTFAVSPRFPWAYVLLACTGAETINTITGGRQGLLLIVEHTDTDCTVADDDAATAAAAGAGPGAGNDVGAAAKVLVLLYNGTSWYEVAESDN